MFRTSLIAAAILGLVLVTPSLASAGTYLPSAYGSRNYTVVYPYTTQTIYYPSYPNYGYVQNYWNGYPSGPIVTGPMTWDTNIRGYTNQYGGGMYLGGG